MPDQMGVLSLEQTVAVDDNTLDDIHLGDFAEAPGVLSLVTNEGNRLGQNKPQSK